MDVASSPGAFCGDFRCGNGHALLSGMMDLAGLRVMRLMMIPREPGMLMAMVLATAMHAWVVARSMAMTVSTPPPRALGAQAGGGSVQGDSGRSTRF